MGKIKTVPVNPDYPRHVHNESGVVYERVYQDENESVIRRPGENTTNKVLSTTDLEENYSKLPQ